MLKRSVLFSGLTLLATSVGVQAQQVTSAVSVEVGTVLAISASGAFAFPTADDSHYTTGYVESTTGPTLTHRANVPYIITLETDLGSTLGFTAAAGRADADPNKPIGDLSIQSDIAGTAVDVQVGANGSANDFYTRAARGGNVSSGLAARLALDYANDPPGTYSTTVVFTMVAQ